MLDFENDFDGCTGYEFTYCNSMESVYGTRFTDYVILPRTDDWNNRYDEIYKMVEYIDSHIPFNAKIDAKLAH